MAEKKLSKEELDSIRRMEDNGTLFRCPKALYDQYMRTKYRAALSCSDAYMEEDFPIYK